MHSRTDTVVVLIIYKFPAWAATDAVYKDRKYWKRKCNGLQREPSIRFDGEGIYRSRIQE